MSGRGAVVEVDLPPGGPAVLAMEQPILPTPDAPPAPRDTIPTTAELVPDSGDAATTHAQAAAGPANGPAAAAPANAQAAVDPVNAQTAVDPANAQAATEPAPPTVAPASPTVAPASPTVAPASLPEPAPS